MILLEKKFDKFFHFFLILIATTIFFRRVCTVIIIIFTIFCIINYKRLKFKKEKAIILFLLIASPFLLELLFFWNNENLLRAIKSIEKVITLLIFPILIIGNIKRVFFLKILYFYSIITTLITGFLFLRFTYISEKFFNVYLKGDELWEFGYKSADSFGMHAPALNMHLAFTSICCFWFLIKSLNEKKALKIFTNILIFGFSFFFVLVVNTRLALLEVLIGVFIILYIEVNKKLDYKKIMVITGSTLILLSTIFLFYLDNNSHMKEKYFKVTFAHINKVGDLDSIENPEATIYNSLVTRLSIWKASYELASKNLLYGVGASDSNYELFKYYKKTNQKFLARNKFPPHNQFLTSSIMFGFLGFITIFCYIFFILYLGCKTKNPVVLSFYLIFFLSNLVDDFLIRFDGIVFSGFWISIFSAYYLKSFQGNYSALKTKKN